METSSQSNEKFKEICMKLTLNINTPLTHCLPNTFCLPQPKLLFKTIRQNTSKWRFNPLFEG